jgi:hypothetical protein
MPLFSGVDHHSYWYRLLSGLLITVKLFFPAPDKPEILPKKTNIAVVLIELTVTTISLRLKFEPNGT